MAQPEFVADHIKVPLSVALDQSLSYRALGLLVALQAAGQEAPDGSASDYQQYGVGNREGRDAVSSARRELRDRGHIRVIRRPQSDGSGSSTEVSWISYPLETGISVTTGNRGVSNSGPYKEAPSELLIAKELKDFEVLRTSQPKNRLHDPEEAIRPRSTARRSRPRPEVDPGPDQIDVIGSNRGSVPEPSAECRAVERFNALVLEGYFRKQMAQVKAVTVSNQKALMGFFGKLHRVHGLDMKQVRMLIDLCALEIPEVPTIPPWRYFMANIQSYLARVTERTVNYDDDSYWLKATE